MNQNDFWPGYSYSTKTTDQFLDGQSGYAIQGPVPLKYLSAATYQPIPAETNLFQAVLNAYGDKEWTSHFYADGACCKCKVQAKESKQANETLDSVQDVLNLIEEACYNDEDVSTTSTFEQAGLLTNDEGLVVYSKDGKAFQVAVKEA